MPLPVDCRLGAYQIVSPLGAGGMGEVYRAHDARLGRDVAIKVLPAGFAEDGNRLRRFEQEARTLAALSHPNVLAVYDVGHHEGSPYLVMELLEGETLRERLASGALPLRRAVELTLQIAHGLAAAHAKGLVHRDLKPANLFITKDGHLKILDFGLAKQAPLQASDLSQLPTREAGSLTSEGLALGTPGYMSPEQVEGKPADTRSDLFAVGVVLYEMLSGRRAFERNSIIETLSATLKEAPPELASPLCSIPASLQGLVARCLEKEPGRRFQSAKELVDDLEAVLAEPASARVAKLGSWPRKLRRPGARALVLVPLLLVAAGAGATFWKGAGKSPALPVPGYSSVVALPSKVMGSQDSAFLTDAIPDTLSTLLGGAEGLEVKVPPSSLQMEKVPGDLGRIAEAYQVKHLLLTTVTVQGESLILNVKLAEAATQKVSWAGQYEGTRTTYNALLQEAAGALARALRPGGVLASTGSAETSEVVLLLQEGRYYVRRYWTRGQAQDYEQARKLYDRALALSPASSRVLVAVALSYYEKNGRDGDLEALTRGEAFARRALEQDPRNGAAWYTLASLEQFKLRPDTRKLYEWSMKAVRYAPRDPWSHGTFGSISAFMAEGGKQAQEMDPLSVNDIGMRATGLIWQGRATEALPILEKAVAEHPDDPFLVPTKAYALVRLGRLAEAEALLERSRPKPSQATSFTEDFWNQVHFTWLAAQGKDEATRSRGTELVRRYLDPKTQALNLWNGVITMTPDLLRLGLREEVLRLLERSLEVGYPPGLIWLSKTPELNPLRGDPRFQKVFMAARELAVVLIQHMDEAKGAGELPRYLEQPLAELKGLANRPGVSGTQGP
ncbi:MAG: protein kinase [Holophagaceae bacterium]|uniref:non-specific serine/threonine protein kinase n=1 Tax=Candidatus Geothrix skivensis TaxID=2954439 RepID=A0A9D7XHK1_9BACT|nr:protein kinase [Candidatus Geothrix skivensis]